MRSLLKTYTLVLLLVGSNSNTVTQGTPYKGSIRPYETQKINLVASVGLKRVLYFQCTGSADLSIIDTSLPKEIASFTDFVSKNSGDCDYGYSCYADPCSVSTCAGAPRATCTSNYCDGCIAEYSIGGEIVDCSAPGTPGEVVFTKGAPPHNAVLQLEQKDYEFHLLGKRSSVDSVNTFQLYVYDNSAAEDTIMLGDDTEVHVDVDNTTIELKWTSPAYNNDSQLKNYCLYYMEAPLGSQLLGDWLACGHAIKDTASPVKCVNGTSASFSNVERNRSHYIWVVAVSSSGTPTAYPFVRVDIHPLAYSRTLGMGYCSWVLVLAAALSLL